jgi:hypothetical protein
MALVAYHSAPDLLTGLQHRKKRWPRRWRHRYGNDLRVLDAVCGDTPGFRAQTYRRVICF